MRRKNLPVFSFLPSIFLVLLAILGIFWWRNAKFGQFDRFNLVIAAKPVTLVSVDNRQGLATVLTFPDDLYVSQVVPKLGGYKMAQVYKVGELDHRGGAVLSWTVEELLGVPIDGFLYRETSIGKDVKGFLLSPANFFGGKTNVSLLDLGRLAYAFLQIRPDRVKAVDLNDLADPLLLADGSKAIGLDKEQLDANLAGDFLETSIQDERLRVEVVNSTLAPGLGSRAARTLTTIGAAVVNVGTSSPELPGCEVRTEKKNMATMTVRRLAAIFQCKIAPASSGRADISVILGTDFAQKF